MIIAIDAGNSRIKWGVHDGRRLAEQRRAGDEPTSPGWRSR
jgi:pantothenate kinase type III